MLLSKFPRVRLTPLPTPLEKLERLSKELGVDIYVKRDDVMTLAFGGNKVRKLEFTLGDAIAKGCDTIVTTGALTSNHARLTAAACRKLGLKLVLVLRGRDRQFPRKVKGNLLLDYIFGADIRIADVDKSEIPRVLREVAEELKGEGYKPYILPTGGATPVGVLGYVNACMELIYQLNERNLEVDYLVHASGTGGTQAGLVLGFKAFNTPIKVIGVSEGTPVETLRRKVYDLANEVAKLLDLNVKIDDSDIVVEGRYMFGGFGVITKEVVDTIKYVARTEGLLLDPIYTAKAMYGLIDMIRNGEIDKGSKVVFLHTGGTPLIFHLDHEVREKGEIPSSV
ncbi:MAG: D-cysteine desulfhydrase family protein [Thermoproteales archaeon]|nr:D-cysteine desulfhydrase family protein [Thermoproteales archaeon]